MLYKVVSKRLRLVSVVVGLLFLPACRFAVKPLGSSNTPTSPFRESAVSVGSDIPTGQATDLPKGRDDTEIPELIAPVTDLIPPIMTPDSEYIESAPAEIVEDELYTVIADGVPVKEILSAIARDADAQVSFVGEIDGQLSLSIVNQPLEFILKQISDLVEVRYEIRDGQILLIEDKPFIRSYEFDYLNMQRVSESRVDLATQIGTLTTGLDEGSSSSGSNGSRLYVENKSVNLQWDSLVRSIGGILGEKIDADTNISENVFVSRESGIVSVRAREAQHRSIESLINKIMQSAQRQVLIEATVVEVTLNDRYESGIDWQALNSSGNGTLQFSQLLAGLPDASSATTPVTALLSYNNPESILGNLSATLKLLQQFGEVQVLSRPRIIALNNQPAVLKVVDNRVYFTFEVDRLERENGDQRTVVDSTIHSVPIGLVMNVTPFISKHSEVILNVRPTISRILNFAEDPSPALAGQNEVRNLIPEIQVREMESLLRVQSGSVAIFGGLMQNKVENRTAGLPGLKRIPVVGRLFSHEVRSVEKTELLIFLKPTVVDRDFTGVQ